MCNQMIGTSKFWKQDRNLSRMSFNFLLYKHIIHCFLYTSWYECLYYITSILYVKCMITSLLGQLYYTFIRCIMWYIKCIICIVWYIICVIRYMYYVIYYIIVIYIIWYMYYMICYIYYMIHYMYYMIYYIVIWYIMCIIWYITSFHFFHFMYVINYIKIMYSSCSK